MQTSYSLEQEKGAEGFLADNGDRVVETALVEGTGLEFGQVVVKGSSDSKVKIPSANSDIVAGVLVFSQEHESGEELENQKVNLGRKCRVWVKVEASVAKYDAGHVRYANGNAGFMRNSAVANETLPVSGKFLSSAQAGELAIFEFDL